MYRIGIIGTENSHAMAFSRIMKKDPAQRARVVGVMGPDGSAERIRDDVGVDFVAGDAGEFFGKVDAMMITCRAGSKHAGYARPFIEAGMPVFIDKPLTADFAEAAALLKLAKQKKVPVCGGSGCRYAEAVGPLKEKAAALRAGNKLVSAAMTYTADAASEYDGFHFYSPHLTEVSMAILGDIDSVQTVAYQNSILVTANFGGLLGSLHYVNGAQILACSLFGTEGTVTEDIGLSTIYNSEVERFLHMLKTGEMPQTYEELAKPVQVACAILESMKTGKPVACGSIAL